MKVNIHAGHNPDGKIACGAVGLIKESTQARKVKNELKKILKARGHKVYDCTVNDGLNQSDVLKKIVDKCNKHAVDVDISIHFNSGANDKTGNGKSTGCEAYVYSNLGCKNGERAVAICKNIAKLGFKNRGAKVRSDLYVLHHTASPAILVECCFVDDKDDVRLYDAKSMATAIADGIELK
jgi:N-acetylmuramoyl-L-alanine amidase